MMGGSHAISGAAVWLALASPAALGLAAPGTGHPLETAGVLGGALVAAGAALTPDIDHQDATTAHSLPVIGRASATAVSKLSGGHRHGTHSLLALPAAALAAWALSFATVSIPQLGGASIALPIGIGIATAALACFALKALKAAKTWGVAWAAGIVFGLLVMLLPWNAREWAPAAIVIGYATHLAGDFLTVGGLPLLWPFKPKLPRGLRRTPVRRLWTTGGRFALPILGATGSKREWALASALTIGVVWIAIVTADAWIRTFLA